MGAELELNRVLKTKAQKEDFIYKSSRKLLFIVKPHSEVQGVPLKRIDFKR